MGDHMKKRKVPQRKCVITNEMKPKGELIRIVRNKEGNVFIDESGKKNGRGAYLSKDIAVIEKAQKSNVLDQQLNSKVDEQIYEELKQMIKGENV